MSRRELFRKGKHGKYHKEHCNGTKEKSTPPNARKAGMETKANTLHETKKLKVTVRGCTDWKDRLVKYEKLTLRVKNWSERESSLH